MDIEDVVLAAFDPDRPDFRQVGRAAGLGDLHALVDKRQTEGRGRGGVDSFVVSDRRTSATGVKPHDATGTGRDHRIEPGVFYRGRISRARGCGVAADL